MQAQDDFSAYYANLLDGQYDCIDRIVLNGYYSLGQQGGGFRTWWRQLTGSDDNLDTNHLQKMAGRFSRRVHAWAKQQGVPLIHCSPGERKHELAEKYLPTHPEDKGVFLILVAKAPALVWDVKPGRNGVPHLQRKTPWPYVNHYHFHIMDPDWGHLTIKMSGHPPFGVQLMLNGHEWVERQARQQTIAAQKAGNCFVGGSFRTLDQLADTLCEDHAIGRVTEVCDRWVYTSCLCFALDTEEQRRSQFHYQYSAYQLEFSRNLVFTRGTDLDTVFQGMIDRTRAHLDVPKLRTIFGYKHRPNHRQGKPPPRQMQVLDRSLYNLTVFKLHFGPFTLKVYDKGARILRVEVIVHNIKKMNCGRVVEKLPTMLARLQRMVVEFLNVIQAAHHSFLPYPDVLDALVTPSQRGERRIAGVDLQKSRMRRVSEAVLALAPNPNGFSAAQLAEKVRALQPQSEPTYTPRHASYDLMKLRGKQLIQRIDHSRRYRVDPMGIRTLAGLLILREKVLKPVLAGAGNPRVGRPPKTIHPIDQHYTNLQREMRSTFETLALAA